MPLTPEQQEILAKLKQAKANPSKGKATSMPKEKTDYLFLVDSSPEGDNHGSV